MAQPCRHLWGLGMWILASVTSSASSYQPAMVGPVFKPHVRVRAGTASHMLFALIQRQVAIMCFKEALPGTCFCVFVCATVCLLGLLRQRCTLPCSWHMSGLGANWSSSGA